MESQKQKQHVRPPTTANGRERGVKHDRQSKLNVVSKQQQSLLDLSCGEHQGTATQQTDTSSRKTQHYDPLKKGPQLNKGAGGVTFATSLLTQTGHRRTPTRHY